MSERRQINDTEIKSIESHLDLFGYSHTGAIIIPDNNILYFDNFTAQKCPQSENILKAQYEITQSKQFMNAFFSLHDILHVDEPNPMEKIDSISPLDLPINIIPGSCETRIKMTTSLDNKTILFNKYCIANHGQTVYSDFCHEVTNTQLLSQRGIIENYENCEVLPILIEIISSYYKSYTALKASLEQRLHYVLLIANNLKKHPEDTFLQMRYSAQISSTYTALCIFDSFIKNNDPYKANIIQRINDIFAGKLTVDELIYSCGFDEKIALENGPKLARIYITDLKLK